MLEPYRVLDLTDVRGQIGGMMLADLGAEVLRIEPPEGSPARRAAPLLDDAPEGLRSLSFAAYNRGKRSVTVALDRPGGPELVRRLAAGCDVFLTNLIQQRRVRYGLTWEEVCAASPRIVYASCPRNSCLAIAHGHEVQTVQQQQPPT